MPNTPISPFIHKGGLVLLDPGSKAVRAMIALQYNPDTLTRTLQVQAVEGEGGDRSQAFRIKGPPVETIKIDAEIDATDSLGAAQPDPNAAQFGIFPQLAALEAIVYPASARLQENQNLAQSGTLEIVPMEAPLVLFVWSPNRILPVRITEFSITEEAFDTNLNPIRAKVSLGLRVLSPDDVGFAHPGGQIFMAALQAKERLAALNQQSKFDTFGIGGIP